MGVAGGILSSAVRLHLDDPSDPTSDHEEHVEESSRHPTRVPGELVASGRLHVAERSLPSGTGDVRALSCRHRGHRGRWEAGTGTRAPIAATTAAGGSVVSVVPACTDT